MTEQPQRCAHCRGTARGYASVSYADGKEKRLCHPDEGMDCYHLVTVYGHEMPCFRVEADLLLTALLNGGTVQLDISTLPLTKLPFGDETGAQ